MVKKYEVTATQEAWALMQDYIVYISVEKPRNLGPCTIIRIPFGEVEAGGEELAHRVLEEFIAKCK